jgi:uncharacterized protein YlxP (DUF503 family)
MHVALLRIEMRVPESRSLKAKRKVLRPIVARLESMRLAVSEVDNQDKWQAATLGVAVVAPSPSRIEELVANVKRVLHGEPRIDVIEIASEYVETP